MAAKTSYHHGNLRQSLIDGAIALIGEAGFEQLSLRQVARRVGVSHNAPYRHFADREALLAAVSEEGFQALCSALEAAQHGISADSPQRLQALGRAYVEFALANPAHYRVMFGQYRCDLSQYPDLAKASQQSFEVLVDTIAKGQSAGIFRAADPVDMARVAWSLVHGQSMLALDNKLQIKSGKDFETFLQFSSQMLFEGLGTGH
ncbi:MAG: TetR/AcrR family transcriptional regulator [Cyanobacteria bacterium P01_G01_bin.38]